MHVSHIENDIAFRIQKDPFNLIIWSNIEGGVTQHLYCAYGHGCVINRVCFRLCIACIFKFSQANPG